MTKVSFAGTSLVGAIPAGFLAYLLVMVMLGNFENLTSMMQVFIWPALLCSVVIALMPVIIMVFMPKSLPVTTLASAGTASAGGMAFAEQESAAEDDFFDEDSGEVGADDEVDDFDDSDYDPEEYTDLGDTDAFDGFEVEDDGIGATEEMDLADFDDSEEFDLFDDEGK